MANTIEKMNAVRNTIVRVVFIGSMFAFGLFMFPTLYSLFRMIVGTARKLSFEQQFRFFEWGLMAWLATILLFVIVYWLYKRGLKRNSALREAVNDERVKLCWLRSYRFAFYMIVFISIFLKVYEFWSYKITSPRMVLLPHFPWLNVFIATLSLTGAFLYFNRGEKGAQDG